MDMAETLYLFVGLVSLYLILRPRTNKPRKHQWYEVDSSDIASAERKKKGGNKR